MISKYIARQKTACKILMNEIINDTVVHAYIFHCARIDIANDFAISFAKTLICPTNEINDSKCKECYLCRRIDDGNYPELKIIKPDGLWIKKDQLVDLKDKFKTKTLEGKDRICIINSADKLNGQSANGMLKFLEDPEQNIIAILTTDNIHNVLPTIISRCQIIYLNDGDNSDYENKENINNTTTNIQKLLYINNNFDTKEGKDAEITDKIEAIIQFVNKYEIKGLDVLLETKKLWNDKFITKDDYLFGFEIMVLLYKDILNKIYGRPIEVFGDYLSDVDKIALLNDNNSIILKLKKLLILKEKIKYNINLNLLIDKLVIEFESEEKV